MVLTHIYFTREVLNIFGTCKVVKHLTNSFSLPLIKLCHLTLYQTSVVINFNTILDTIGFSGSMQYEQLHQVKTDSTKFNIIYQIYKYKILYI